MLCVLHRPLLPAVVSLLVLCACSAPAPQVVTDCRYAERTDGIELLFVLPSIEQQSHGEGGIAFYAAPQRDSRLFFSSLTYVRDYAGKRYRRLATVSGSDGAYDQWLTEDCRLLYTPVDNGPLPAAPH